jgi:hypothetical protein
VTLLRRFLALLLALALGAVAVLVIVEAIGVRAGESPVVLPLDVWERELTDGAWSRWSTDEWAIASGVALAVGVLLLVLQLIPHRSTVLDRQHEDGAPVVRFGRFGLQDRLRDLAIEDPAVLGAAVRVSKRRVEVTARVPSAGDREAARRSVRESVGAELDRLRLAERPKLKVHAEQTGRRVL